MRPLASCPGRVQCAVAMGEPARRSAFRLDLWPFPLRPRRVRFVLYRHGG
jgi:hypothetical protein